MVSQAVAIGVPGLTMDAVNNEAFYHQQVHEALGVLGTEESMYQGTGKPSVLRRPGATLAREADLEGMSFNTNFLEAEFEWTREFAHRIMTQTILQRDIRDKYDKMPEMAEKADKRNWETACRCVADPAIPGKPTDAVATAKGLRPICEWPGRLRTRLLPMQRLLRGWRGPAWPAWPLAPSPKTSGRY